MPLFLNRERDVNAPLERTYTEAYHGMPAFCRSVIEGGEPPPQETTSGRRGRFRLRGPATQEQVPALGLRAGAVPGR